MWKRALKRRRAEAERLAAVSPRQGPDGPAAPSGGAVHAPRDVPDPRAKSAVHGKVTADKWNQ